MTRFTGWTVAGVILAMLIGTLHAITAQILEQPLFPRGWFRDD